MEVPTAEEIARFMGYVERLSSGCWYWTGARSRGRGNRKWYGSFWFRGRMIRAHRFAHDYLGGRPLPEGWHRDHTCAFSMCVNPDHLAAVPPETNQDRITRRHLCGVCVPCSESHDAYWSVLTYRRGSDNHAP